MRVLHLDTGKTWRGGQRQVLYLHKGLRERGVESRLVCSRGGELLGRAAREGVPAEGLSLRGEWDVASAVRLGALVRRWRPAVVHAHSSHAVTLAHLGVAAGGGRGAVVATRRVDFVPARHLLNRWKYGRLARLVVISRAIGAIMEAFGYPRERIRLVPSGVALGSAAPREGLRVRRELGVGEGELLVGNIAHLADHKGQRFLVDAIPAVVARCPRARFAIVGEGELAADLRAKADELGLGSRLLFTGFRDDVAAVMEALDLFVMASHLEGLGTIVLDALAAGKPVVATRAGGIPEMIEDGRHGLLVPPRDSIALSGAILRLLENPTLARGLAEEGRRRVFREFSADAMVEGNLAVYGELTGTFPHSVRVGRVGVDRDGRPASREPGGGPR